MTSIGCALWIAGQAVDALLFWWPVSLVLALLVCVALVSDIWRGRLRLDRRFALLFLPAISILVILPLGGLFEGRARLFYLPCVGFGVGIALAVASGIAQKRAWMSSVSVSLCCLWYSLWCGLVAIMTINGDFL